MSAKIKTFARVRPLNEDELTKETTAHQVVVCTDEQSLVFNPSSLRVVAPSTLFSTTRGRQNYDQTFTFDGSFHPGCSEDEVYSKVAFPLLLSAMQGRNASMFAYGATGCGKSHTINAIQDRIATDIMNCIAEAEGDVSLRMTYLQMYNEKITDLLPNNKLGIQPLDIRDSTSRPGSVQVIGLTEYSPGTSEEIRELIARGNRNRVIASTKANSESSRSHAILTFFIETQSKNLGPSKHSLLSIIDLAGCERAQATNNRGQRLNEGANINKSLLALGNCIKARVHKFNFVPYRESKLTRLLRFSLEGDCETAMVVCISASLKHFDETKNSLEYGKRVASMSRPAQSQRGNQRTKLRILYQNLNTEYIKLTKWKTEVIEAFIAQSPELAIQIESLGGSASISASEFATLVHRVINSTQHTSRLTDTTFQPGSQERSPLKRTRRNFSAGSTVNSHFNERSLASPSHSMKVTQI